MVYKITRKPSQKQKQRQPFARSAIKFEIILTAILQPSLLKMQVYRLILY